MDIFSLQVITTYLGHLEKSKVQGRRKWRTVLLHFEKTMHLEQMNWFWNAFEKHSNWDVTENLK